MSEPAVPKLNLAPRLSRPLSLLNPLDYLRLLYWSFFFPQALRWYVDHFCDPPNQATQQVRASWQCFSTVHFFSTKW